MKVKVPSDKDAVRIHVLTQPEEMQYFTAAAEIPHLYDLGRLMILQGPRPYEVMHARVEHVDFRNGTWFIPISKSMAGRRTLKLVPEALAIMQARVAAADQCQVGSSRERPRVRISATLRTVT